MNDVVPRVLTNASKLQFLVNLAASITIPGDFAECGVYQGGTLINLARARPNRTVYGFDTFDGLPQSHWSRGEIHDPGEFCSNLEFVRKVVKPYPNIILKPGLFPDSASAVDVTNRKFALVYLDFDFYLSTIQAIRWFRPRMPYGAVMVFDDFNWPFCPGVRRAILEEGMIVEEPVAHLAVWIKSEEAKL